MNPTHPIRSWKNLPSLFALLVLANNAPADQIQVGDIGLQGGVATANARLGHPDTIVAPHFYLNPIAQGLEPLENPSGVITQFGYLNDSSTHSIEATKTEPDESTYLVLDHNPGGPESGYDYGRHFLFQGHENAGNLAYITRINLDVANPDHHITLLTPVGQDQLTHFNSIDGSTWNPFTRMLLFTQEAGNSGGVIELSPEYGSAARTLYGVMGRGGYEGIHPDDQGNIYLVEDAGGASVNVDPNDPLSAKAAKVPNSYLYRFVPKDRTDLSAGGVLQALQVKVDGQPVTYVPVDAAHPTGDAFSATQLKLHTIGQSWPVTWVTVHNTDTDGTVDFDANALARAAGATPLKRPENGQFQPGSGFRTFFFDVTGDTDSRAGNVPDLAARGAWGGIFRLDLDGSRKSGSLTLVVLGDAEHAAFDNLAFASQNILLAAEDRGDTLHAQLNRLDSVWAFDVSRTPAPAQRFIALGRDKASEVDVGLAGTPGFQNEGDNEPTGLHISDGGASIGGLLGRTAPGSDALIVFTQQHGENNLYMVIPAKAAKHHDHD